MPPPGACCRMTCCAAPWEAAYRQTRRRRRWLRAGVFEEMVDDSRVPLRLPRGRAPEPTAAAAAISSTRAPPDAPPPESGSGGGYYDGAKRNKGSEVHAAAVGAPSGTSCSPSTSPRRTSRGPRAGGRAGEGRARSDRGVGGARGVRGPGLHRRGARGLRSGGSRHPLGRWSSIRRRSGASCFYHAAGSWDAIPRGHRGSGGRSRTTRGHPPLWRACTSSRSLVCSFSRRPASSARVHNTL